MDQVPSTSTIPRHQRIVKVSTSALTIHPLVSKIYDYKKSKEIKLLGKTMMMVGQLEPIVITPERQILSGNRRHKAALFVGMRFLNAIIVDVPQDKIEQTIVFHNQQRKKTYKEIIHEAEAILGVLGVNQGKRNDMLGNDPGNPFGKIGKDRFEIAAKVIGDIGARSLRRLMDIVKFENENSKLELGLVEKVVNGELTINRGSDLIKQYQEILKEKAKKPVVKLLKNSTDNNYTIYNTSSSKMSEVKTSSVQLVVTSPPYYNLRKYNNSTKKAVELGHESTPKEFISNLVKHLKDVKRVLKPTGSFFLNIGDTYHKGENLLISTRLLLDLCDKEGWFLVNEIIWKKTNPTPHDRSKRLQPCYEKVFHLVKEPEKYYYTPLKIWNGEEMKLVPSAGGRNASGNESTKSFNLSKPYKQLMDFVDGQGFRDIIVGTNAGARQIELGKIDFTIDHPALMPEYLPFLPILTTTKEDDIILDPFSGSATTGKVALLLGRKYIGYEINKTFYDLSLRALNSTKEMISKKESDIINKLVK